MSSRRTTRILVAAALAGLLSTVAVTSAEAAAAPVISWEGAITDQASYVYGQVPAANTCTAVDEAAQPVECTVSGYDTSVGTHLLTATATAADAPTATETISYTVTAWNLRGFYRPVRMNDRWNNRKGRSTVPFKFRVFEGTTKATSTDVVTAFTAQQLVCSTMAPIGDATSILSTKKGYRLRYRDGKFIMNWKTPKAPKAKKVKVTKVTKVHGKKVVRTVKRVRAVNCYQVTMTTADGSALTALFKLR